MPLGNTNANRRNNFAATRKIKAFCSILDAFTLPLSTTRKSQNFHEYNIGKANANRRNTKTFCCILVSFTFTFSTKRVNRKCAYIFHFNSILFICVETVYTDTNVFGNINAYLSQCWVIYETHWWYLNMKCHHKYEVVESNTLVDRRQYLTLDTYLTMFMSIDMTDKTTQVFMKDEECLLSNAWLSCMGSMHLVRK